jgi:hypothetical protein
MYHIQEYHLENTLGLHITQTLKCKCMNEYTFKGAKRQQQQVEMRISKM